MTVSKMVGMVMCGVAVACGFGRAVDAQADDTKDEVRDRPTAIELVESSVVVRTRAAKGKVIVDAVLNGRGTWPMALDSSARHTVLDDDIANVLKLERKRRIEWSPGRGEKTQTAEVATLRSVGIGSAGLLDFDVIIVDLDTPADGTRPYAGILGQPLFSDLVLMVDHEGDRMMLRKEGLGSPDGKETFDVKGQHGELTVPVVLGDKTVDAVIETGLKAGLLLPDTLKDAIKVEARLPELAETRGLITDVDLSAVAASDVIKLGRFELYKVPITFGSDKPRIGREILRRFMISFDAKNDRLGITRLAGDSVTFPVMSRYGFVFVREGEGLEVLHTMPGSIAERCVINEGDRITRLLGVPIPRYTDAQIVEILRDRDLLHFTVDRGGFPLLVPVNAE